SCLAPWLWLPVNHAEVARVSLKKGLFSLVVLFPFAAAYTVVAMWRCGEPPPSRIGYAFPLGYLLFTPTPLGLVIGFSMSTDDPRTPFRMLLGIAVALVVLAMAFAGWLALCLIRDWHYTLPIGLLMGGCSFGLLRFYLWVLTCTSVDWVRSDLP